MLIDLWCCHVQIIFRLTDHQFYNYKYFFRVKSKSILDCFYTGFSEISTWFARVRFLDWLYVIVARQSLWFPAKIVLFISGGFSHLEVKFATQICKDSVVERFNFGTWHHQIIFVCASCNQSTMVSFTFESFVQKIRTKASVSGHIPTGNNKLLSSIDGCMIQSTLK